MKKIYLLVFALGFAAFAFNVASAQCNRTDIKNKAKKKLTPYHIEHVAIKELSSFEEYRRDTIEAEFWVYAKDRYKVVNLCTGFGQPVELIITDPDKNVIFKEKGEPEDMHHIFIAKRSGKYSLSFVVGDEDKRKGSGCISFAIGYALKAF